MPRNLFKILVLVLIGGLLIYMGVIFYSYLQVRDSGTLVVTTPNPDSLVTVSAVNKTAETIGTGNARVRLQPGEYLVGVARLGRVSFQTTTIRKNMVTSVNLAATSTPLLPSAASIDFQGTDALLAKGLTNEQIAAIREAIFRFNTHTKTATVQQDSVVSGPYDPNSDSPLVTRNFTLVLDGKPYVATASWVDVDTATLALRDQAGNVIYDSAAGHD